MSADMFVGVGVFCNRLQHLIMVVDEVGDFAPSENGHLSLWAFAVPAEVEVLHVEIGDVVSHPLLYACGHSVSRLRDYEDAVCAIVADQTLHGVDCMWDGLEFMIGLLMTVSQDPSNIYTYFVMWVGRCVPVGSVVVVIGYVVVWIMECWSWCWCCSVWCVAPWCVLWCGWF